MKRETRKPLEHDSDEKVESRIGLKNKLYNIGGGDFDLSVFTESNNEQRFTSIFPQINEPTLEDSEPGQNLKLNQDSGLEQYYGEGVTARNSYQKGRSNSSQIYLLQMKVDELTQEMALQQAELVKYKNTVDILQKETERLNKQLQRKNQISQVQRRQLSELRHKGSVMSVQQSCSSQSKSMNESLNAFCPQLLSPEQTVQLLSQLLKKVGKSSKMMKSLTSNQGIKDMLQKMNKN